MATSVAAAGRNPLCYALWAAFVWPFWLVRPEPYVGWLVLAPVLVLTQRSVQPAVAALPAIAGASFATTLAHYFGVFYGLIHFGAAQRVYPTAYWSAAAVLGVVAALAITWMWRRPPGRT